MMNLKQEQATCANYAHGQLLADIKKALSAQNKSLSQLTLADLAPVDEFHVGGRQASAHFLAQLNLSSQDSVLDIGCALGGTARFVASTYQSNVVGIDVSDEYIATGNILSQWLQLTKKVKLLHASAFQLPFTEQCFSKAYMMHVGMNIADKTTLFYEVSRVLKQSGYFGIYDIVKQKQGALAYPVPWASTAKNSYIATLEHYEQALNNTGFEVIRVNNRHKFAIDFFNKLIMRNDQPKHSELSIHTLIKAESKIKMVNMLTNIQQDLIAPVEIIARKK